MCRSIVTLRGQEPPPDDNDIEAAARQFIRKVSGYRHPSKANEAAFERAIQEVADATTRLLGDLVTAAR
jgi:hypothetical protein